jgi:hypothetical protein
VPAPRSGIRGVVAALLAGAAVGLAGCGNSGGGDGASSASPAPPAPTASSTPAATGRVLRLGPGDNAETVRMAVGDRLVVLLSGGRLTGSWALASYPRDILASQLGSVPPGGFGFVARAPGSGSVELVRPLCGPASAQPCAAGGGIGPSSTAPVRWSVVVVVS